MGGVSTRAAWRLRLRRAGPEGWAARALTGPSAPTADLYIANACADWLADGRLTRVAPTVFATDAAYLILRHDARLAPGFARKSLVYFIDDAWEAGPRDPSLSRFVRSKLAMVERHAARVYMPQADAVVVSCAALRGAAETRARGPVHVIDPYWSEPLADLAHFDRPGTDIAFLGAQLHDQDLRFLLPVLEAVLAAHDDVTLTVSAGHALPPALAAHPRLRRMEGLRWHAYRAALPARRFHLALYPLRATPFNAGRSANKIIEHAVVGAAPLTSQGWPPGEAAAAAGAGLSLPEDPRSWAAAIETLLADRPRMRALAGAARDHAAALNHPDPQRALWTALLHPGPPTGPKIST